MNSKGKEPVSPSTPSPSGASRPRRSTTTKVVVLFAAVGCGIPFVLLMVLFFVIAATKSGQPSRKGMSGPSDLIVTDSTVTFNPSGWQSEIHVVNVSKAAVHDARVVFVWRMGASEISHGEGGLRGSLDPGEMTTLTASGRFESSPFEAYPSVYDIVPASHFDELYRNEKALEEVLSQHEQATARVEKHNREVRQELMKDLDLRFLRKDGTALSYKIASSSRLSLVEVAAVKLAERREEERAARAEADQQKRVEESVAREHAEEVEGAVNEIKNYDYSNKLGGLRDIIRGQFYAQDKKRYTDQIDQDLVERIADLRGKYHLTQNEVDNNLRQAITEVETSWRTDVESLETSAKR
jgi:hypothetical protein